MRRAIVTLFAVLLLSLAAAVPSAGAFTGVVAQSAASGQSAQSVQSGDDGAAGAPSIVPSPNQRGKNNVGGLIVGAVMLGGWGVAGYFLYRQAQRRRSATVGHDAL